MIERGVICSSTGVHHRWRPQFFCSSSVPYIWHLFSSSLRRQITSETLNCSFHRSCSCVEGKSDLTVQNMSRRWSRSRVRSTGVYNSHGPKEFHIDNGVVGRDNKLLIDCGQDCVVGGIVALGKFDALHIGHRELAIQASKTGNPFLLSFVGIGEVLGWEPRAPIVAKCDRKRVLSSWAPYCGDVIPEEYQVEFSTVRHLSPSEFVERLSRELRINGVVAGKNYRFGYRASGDSSELVRLCKEYGLVAYIVSAVMDERQSSSCNGVSTTYPVEREMVSSTRVRQALGMGDIGCVTKLLGRKHRLVLVMNGECISTDRRISLPKSNMLNLPPQDGVYGDCNLVVEEKLVRPCKVTFDPDTIHIDLECGGSMPPLQLDDHSHNKQLIGIEFGC